MPRHIALILFLCLFIHCEFLVAQVSDSLKERGVELGVRVNTILDFNSDRLYTDSGFQPFTYQRNQKTKYYYTGVSITDNRPNGIFYRVRFNYFYYNNDYNFRMDDANGNYSVTNGNYSTNGLEIAPGTGKFLTHKFLSFKFGIEIPLYLAGQGKQQESQKDFYAAGGNDELKVFVDYPKGAYSLGLATFISIEYNFLNGFAVAFENSSGIYYLQAKGTSAFKYEYYNTSGQLYDTQTRENNINDKGYVSDLFNASLGVFYRF